MDRLSQPDPARTEPDNSDSASSGVQTLLVIVLAQRATTYERPKRLQIGITPTKVPGDRSGFGWASSGWPSSTRKTPPRQQEIRRSRLASRIRFPVAHSAPLTPPRSYLSPTLAPPTDSPGSHAFSGLLISMSVERNAAQTMAWAQVRYGKNKNENPANAPIDWVLLE